MMRLFLCTGLILIAAITCPSQDSTSKKHFQFSGFADIYYQYDFDKPAAKDRPFFLYNHKRHNEISINLALLKLTYQQKKLKANLAIMAGNYAQYNLSAEPKLLKNIYEANIGYEFSKKLSVDVGIFPSHIGIESAISKDNWNMSRSLLAENSPYFETGIKVTFTPNKKWTTTLFVLNGWQNIQETNSSKAIGTQVQFKPTDKWLFNSSTFIGNEKPNNAKQLRLFHNFYATYTPTSKIGLSVLLDAGAEKKFQSDGYNNWMGAGVLLKYSPIKKWSATGRIEYYKDKNGVLIFTNTANGFNTSGYSLNIDYQPTRYIVFRADARYLNSKDEIFEKNGIAKKDNFSLLGSIAVWF
jgi:hypothetical protein